MLGGWEGIPKTCQGFELLGFTCNGSQRLFSQRAHAAQVFGMVFLYKRAEVAESKSRSSEVTLQGDGEWVERPKPFFRTGPQ